MHIVLITVHCIIDNIVPEWIRNGIVYGGIYGDTLKQSLQRTAAVHDREVWSFHHRLYRSEVGYIAG